MRVARALIGFLLLVPDQAALVLENIATALVQIWANKVRSLLTVLGIIIAVTSIITVVSFVEGFGNYVTTMLRGYGTQYIVVYPFDPQRMHRGGMRRTTMDMADVHAVRVECENVHRISPFIYTKVDVSYGGEVAEETHKESGNISYAFSSDLSEAGVFHIFEEWESQEALDAHFQSPHMAKFQGALGGLGVKGMNVQRYQVSSVGPLR